MTTSSWQASRVVLVSVVMLSSLAWAQKSNSQASRAACVSEATPLFSSSWSGRDEYVARLCKRPTPSLISCVKDVQPSLTVMSDWDSTVESLCSRATPNTAECFLGVRQALSFRSDWMDIAVAMCRRATPQTLGCFREALSQRSFDSDATIRNCGGG